jgi:hypothetical protein
MLKTKKKRRSKKERNRKDNIALKTIVLCSVLECLEDLCDGKGSDDNFFRQTKKPTHTHIVRACT